MNELAVCEEWLEPGDRLLLHSDGVVEARNAEGEEAAPEVMLRLTQALLLHRTDRLQDDATNMLVEWRTHRESRLVPEPR